jgi:hypothetical protein
MNMTPLRGLPFGVRLNARLGVIGLHENLIRIKPKAAKRLCPQQPCKVGHFIRQGIGDRMSGDKTS